MWSKTDLQTKAIKKDARTLYNDKRVNTRRRYIIIHMNPI